MGTTLFAMSDKGGFLDNFEQATVDGKFRQENEECSNKHNSATKEAIRKVHVRGDAVIK